MTAASKQADTHPCPNNHGPMPRRTHRQSREAEWCGTWYDCEHCTCSVLLPSEGLRKQLAEMNAAQTQQALPLVINP